MKNIAKLIDANTIHVFNKTQFDVDAIMHSGQVFRYFPIDGGYRVIVGNNVADITGTLIKCSDAKYFWNYFDLDTDYDEIKEQLSKYKSIKKILVESNAGGIRILRGEFIETVISFIISANNNIKRFTKTLNQLCQQYGTNNAFPTLEQLSVINEEDFKRLGCGYRSGYLIKAVRQLKDINIEKLSKLNNADLIKQLRTIQGVGEKVAFCIALFCGDFHRLDIAPRDTWIKKALEQLPEPDREVLTNHKYAGVAQQYIFYYLQYLRRSVTNQ